MWMVRHDRPLTNYTESRMGLGHALCSYPFFSFGEIKTQFFLKKELSN